MLVLYNGSEKAINSNSKPVARKTTRKTKVSTCIDIYKRRRVNKLGTETATVFLSFLFHLISLLWSSTDRRSVAPRRRNPPRNHELPFSLLDDGPRHQVVGICVCNHELRSDACTSACTHPGARRRAPTAESSIDNIIEPPRFLAAVAVPAIDERESGVE